MRFWPLGRHHVAPGAPLAAEKIYTCLHCLKAERTVLYVCHDEGDLVFACGADDHEQSADHWLLVHLRHLLDRDPTLEEVLDLPNNSQAERAAREMPWTRGPLAD